MLIGVRVRAGGDRAAILDGYRAGLADEQTEVPDGSLERAWATHLATRFVFSALILEQRDDLDAEHRATLLRTRAALARYGLDLARRYCE